MKKLVGLILAIMMIAAVEAAFAVNSDTTQNAYNGIENSANTIGIAKEIIFVNAENTTVREPNITYTYTIATTTPGTATITGLDMTNKTTPLTSQVKAGPIEAVSATTATVSFADINAKITATANGTSDRKYANFTFTPATFGAAGIYRYQISETQSPAKATVGIDEKAIYSATRYLDVYVKWDTNHENLEIYGYVLFEGTATDSIEYNDTAELASKSQGFVDTSTTAGAHTDVDVYTTENLLISKTTTGSMADKNHNFPVTITFTKASGLSDSIKLDFAVANSGTLTKTGTDTNSVDYVTMDAALSGTVRDTSTITITGVPYGSTVTMTETNNTYDSYRVKAGTTSGAANLLTEATVAANATSGATTSQTLNAKQSIYITNTLDAISPTGYVSRFAPYALILIGGIALLIIAKKRRPKEEEE